VRSDAEQVPVIVNASAGTELASGARIGLALPQDRTYFFDAETGAARRISPSLGGNHRRELALDAAKH